MEPVIDFNIELKFPDESVPLYTAQDYMRDTNNGSRKDYDCMLAEAEARGQGFGFTYMSAVEQSVNGHGKAWADYNRIRKDAADHQVNVNFEKTGDLLNSILETTYSDAAIAMQGYIIRKGGVIDCWPDANSASTFDFLNVKKGEPNTTTKVGINYFASKIEKNTDDDGTHYYRPRKPFYRNACPYVRTPDMIRMEKKIHELSSVPTYKKGEKFKNNFLHIVCALPLILSVIAVLLMTFWRITGTDAVAAVSSISWKGMGKIGTMLMIIPGIVLHLLALIHELLGSTVALIIGDVVLLALGFVGYGALGGMIYIDRKWISKKDIKKSQTAVKELEALKASDEYKRVIKENGEHHKAQLELSGKWHRAWYEKVKDRVYYMENA